MLSSFIFPNPNHLTYPLLLRNVLLYNTLLSSDKSHFILHLICHKYERTAVIAKVIKFKRNSFKGPSI